MPTKTVTLYPTSSTFSGGSDEVGSYPTPGADISTFHDLVDDWDTGATTDDGVVNTNFATSSSYVLFRFDMPVDFLKSLTGSPVTLKVHVTTLNVPGAADTITIETTLAVGINWSFSGTTTVYTSIGQSSNHDAEIILNDTASTTVDIVDWVDHYLRFDFGYSRDMGSDAVQAIIKAVELTIEYQPSEFIDTPPTGAMTFTGYAPTAFETVLVYVPKPGLIGVNVAQGGPPHGVAAYLDLTDNVNQWFQVNNAFEGLTSPTDPFTIECWYYNSSTFNDSSATIFAVDHAGGNGFMHMLTPYRMQWNGEIPSGAYGPRGVWQHHAITYDGQKAQYWRHGVLQNQAGPYRESDTAMEYAELIVGAYRFSGGTNDGYELIGLWTDIRVTKAVRYTTPFTPEGPFPIGNADPFWDDVNVLVNFGNGFSNDGPTEVIFEQDSIPGVIVGGATEPLIVYNPGFWLEWVVLPDTGQLTFTGHVPNILGVMPVIPTATLEITTYAPSIPHVLVPPGQLTFTGIAPDSYAGPSVYPDTGALTFTGHIPTIDNNFRAIWEYPRVYNTNGLTNQSLRSCVPFLWPDYAEKPYTALSRPRVWRSLALQSSSLTSNTDFYEISGSNHDNGTSGLRYPGYANTLSAYTKWSFTPGTTPDLYLNRIDGSDGVMYPTPALWADYVSTGGNLGYPYGAFAMRHSAGYFATVLQYSDDVASGSMVRVDPLPYYGSAVGLQDWVGNFYALDSRVGTEDGYLLAPKVAGNDTVASLYHWTGGTSWDAGTNLTDGTEEAVDYITDIVGWCRADQADPDRYYAVITTRDAGTNAFLNFKVFAVVLSTMTITRVINDNVDHGGNGWWHEGHMSGGTGVDLSVYLYDFGFIVGGPEDRQWYNPGTTHAEERCFPVSLGPSSTYHPNEDFFVFRTYDDAGAEAYTRLVLNSGNWLAPTYDVRPTGLSTNFPPYPAADGTDNHGYSWGLRRFNGHYLLWDSETAEGEGLYALRITMRGSRDLPGWEIWASTRNVLDPNDTFTDFRPIWKQTSWSYNSSQYGYNAFGWLNGGVRGWGQQDGLRVPITYDAAFARTQGWNASGNGEYWGVYWWEEGNSYHEDVTVVTDLNLQNTVQSENKVVGTLTTDLGLGVEIGEVEHYGSLYFTGHYELEDAESLIDVSVDSPLGLSCEIADDSSVSVNVTMDLGLGVDITEEVIQNLRIKTLGIHNAYWGQSWVDEFIVLVNADRTILGLTPFMAIDGIDNLRITENQVSSDPPQLVAQDLRDNDSNVPFQPGNNYPTGTTLAQAMNAKALLTYPYKRQYYSSMPTPAEMYATWGNISGFWDIDFDDYHGDDPGTNTEIYIQVGRAWRDSATYGSTGEFGNSPREDGIYFYSSLANYTGWPYTGIGGGFKPTQHPITTRTLEVSASVHGITWLEEFLEILNVARANAGVDPYLLPDKAFWELHPIDVASIHADNQFDVQIFCHEAPELPVGWQLISERTKQAGWKNMWENNILSFADPYHDPSTPTAFTYFDILSDYTFITPLEAFTGWWNSPGHKAGMMKDWGFNREVYCVMGWRTRQYTAGTLFEDNVHAGNPQIPVDGQTTILVNNFADVTTEMATRYFNANYTFNGAMIEVLDVEYDILTYTDVKVEHQLAYSLHIALQHEATYVARVAAEHEAPIFYSVSGEHIGEYTSTVPLRTDHDASYRIKDTTSVKQDHTAPYGWIVVTSHTGLYDSPPLVSADHRADYGDLGAVRVEHISQYSAFATVAVAHLSAYADLPLVAAQHEASYSEQAFVAASHTAEYSTPYGVSASHTGVYALQALVRGDHQAPYIGTSTLRTDHEGDYSINTVDTVVTDHTAYHSILGDAVITETPVVTITVGGQTLDIDDLVITQSEGDPAWVARARIPKQETYNLLTQQSPVTVAIGAEVWNLIVTEQSVTRSAQANTRMLVKMESPVVNLMSPRAPSTTFRYETDMSAKAIVEDILGQAVDWEIQDWTVSAGRVAIDDTTPYDAAKLIVEVAGGMLQSKLDGTLKVRYWYPVAMNQLYGVPADEVFTDIEDNLSAEEGFEYRTGINNVRILEGESTFRDRLEWEPETGDLTRGILNVYLAPWRSNYTLSYTDSDGAVSFGFAGTITREEVELIEFRNGTAATSYPVKELSGIDWKSDPLGAVTFDEYSNTLNAGTGVNQGYGLAEITYVVQLDTYNVTGVLGDAAQFIIEDGE